jgi:hypothetical protein
LIEKRNQTIVFEKLANEVLTPIAVILDPGSTSLLTTDPAGNQTGATASGSVVMNIPGSAYFPTIPAVVIAEPQAGSYTTQVQGLATGDYEVVTSLVSPTQIVAQSTVNGSLTDGQTVSYSLNLQPSAGTVSVANSSAISSVSGRGTYGGSSLLTATLSSEGMPLSGKSIAFALNEGGTVVPVGTATTDQDGVATLSVGAANLGGIHAGTSAGAVEASFAGDSQDASTSASGSLNLSQATPTITWPAPAGIVSGTPLGSAQLDASAPIAGSFVYTPAAGTILPPGPGQVLSVTFVPSDTTDYASATATTVINVASVTPPPSPPAPTGIIGVVRSRKGLTAITVGFDAALNPGSAMNPAFYGVLAPVKKHRKTVYSKTVPIRSASLGGNGQTVTINLGKPFKGVVQLTVRTGILGVSGAASVRGFAMLVS